MLHADSKTQAPGPRPGRLLVIALLALTMAACSTAVTRSPEAGLQTPQFDAPGKKAGDFKVQLTDQARVQAVGTGLFDQTKLQGMIRQALETSNILSPAPDPARPTVEITVTEVKVRSSFSAVMWGFLAGDDHIYGTVVVRAPDQTVLQEYVVESSYAFGGLAGGEVGARMNWLYESFAEHVAAELTGRPVE